MIFISIDTEIIQNHLDIRGFLPNKKTLHTNNTIKLPYFMWNPRNENFSSIILDKFSITPVDAEALLPDAVFIQASIAKNKKFCYNENGNPTGMKIIAAYSLVTASLKEDYGRQQLDYYPGASFELRFFCDPHLQQPLSFDVLDVKCLLKLLKI